MKSREDHLLCASMSIPTTNGSMTIRHATMSLNGATIHKGKQHWNVHKASWFLAASSRESYSSFVGVPWQRDECHTKPEYCKKSYGITTC
jgi:hypothetical protein